MIHPKVEEFIAFCEKMPADRVYDWSNSVVCALGQFNNFNSVGWHDEFEQCNEIAGNYPRKFGPLAKRLKLAFS